MGRVGEFFSARKVRGKLLFTGTRRHSHSFKVRAEQMAEELNGVCLRVGNLTAQAVATSPALIWIVEADLSKVRYFEGLTPQLLDVINPVYEPERRSFFYERCRAFRYLMLNTKSTRDYLGPVPELGWKSWVVPHHHCNVTGYQLEEARVERPRVVGYLGEPEHLHDREAIEEQVRKLGLTFMTCGSTALKMYEHIDIGISWSRPDEMRDKTRSNIKMTNFLAHGIPSVACDYESYRDVDEAVGGNGAVIRKELSDWLDALAELAQNEELRRSIAAKGQRGFELYSRQAIGGLYRGVIGEARRDLKELIAEHGV